MSGLEGEPRAGEPIVSVRDLEVTAGNGDRILNSVSLDLFPGHSIGLVGESGSGKTALAHALLGYARPGLHLTSGSVRVQGSELIGRSERDLRALRGRVISYVPAGSADVAQPVDPRRQPGARDRAGARTRA